MADGVLHTKPKQRPTNALNKKKPIKFYNHFIFKALIVTLFLVIIPLFPSEPPDFVSPSVYTRGWELVRLIFVGIAVSYGLFSRKTEDPHVENPAKFDTAHSYMSKLLHVTSVFDDDVGTSSHDHDENVGKIQTWSSKYSRNEPMLVVAEKRNVVDSNSGEKPLLLPVRSLRSRVSEENDGGVANKGYNRSNTSPTVKGFSSNSKRLSRNDVIGLVTGEDGEVSRGYVGSNSSPRAKGFSNDSKKMSRNGSVKSSVAISNEFGFGVGDGDDEVSKPLNRSNSNLSRRGSSSISSGDFELDVVDVEEHKEKVEGSVVLPSPIPWRSRSGKMETNLQFDDVSSHSLPPSLEESEAARLLNPKLSRSFNSSSSSSSSPKENSPRKLSPSPTMTSESAAKSFEDVGRRKSVFKSHLPPPPPPPPPPPVQRSRLAKSSSSRDEGEVSNSHKEYKRSVKSEPKDVGMRSREGSLSPRNGIESSYAGKSVRSIRTNEIRSKDVELAETESPTKNNTGFNPMSKASFSDYPKETRDFLEQVLLETDDESESEGEHYGDHRLETAKIEELHSDHVNDEGPDVDKKADEFIAKFREQIRLQRIESIKKTAGQLKRSTVSL